jgi:hypothetical protein
MKRTLPFFVIFSLTLLCCNPDDEAPLVNDTRPEAFLAYESSNEMSGVEIGSIEGGTLLNDRTFWQSDAGQRITAISISPNGAAVAMASLDSSQADSRDWQGFLYIFDFDEGAISDSLGKASLIEALNFPNGQAAMHIVALGWDNDSVLIAHVRPRTDFLPIASANIAMRYSTTTSNVIELLPSSSTEGFAIAFPAHPEKTLYAHVENDGMISIEGNQLESLPPINRYDISFRLPD